MIHAKQNHQTLEAIGLFLASLFIFTVGLHQQEIIGFESRFYQFDLEMWRHGFQWFPTTYSNPYPDYPVTSTFLTYALAHLVGSMNKLVAVFPSAIAAAIVVMMTYLIGTLHNKNWGLCAIFFLGLTFTFVKSARSISLDMYSTMVTVCCFYLVYSADLLRQPRRVFYIYPLLILGFVFRGPIGLVVPTGVICFYYFVNRDVQKGLITGCYALMILVVCTGVLLALANHVGGQSLMRAVWYRQVFGRLNHSNVPFYFYFTNSFVTYALSYPIALLVIVGSIMAIWQKRIHSREKKFLISLVSWVLVILIGFSIPADKKMRYILPMVPALALICAYPFAFAKQTMPLVRIRRILSGFFLYFPVICLLVAEAVYFYLKGHQIQLSIYFTPVIIIFVLLQLLNFWIIFFDIWSSGGDTVFTFFTAAMSFILFTVVIVEPIQYYQERTREFVSSIEQERVKQHALLAFYQLAPDGFPIKYMINMPEEQQPLFVSNEEAISKIHTPAYFVARVPSFSMLSNDVRKSMRIVAYDTVGHVKIVVFTNVGPLNDSKQ